MVVCSNTLWRNDDDVRRDWEQFGLGDCFSAYVTSHDAGVGIPSPASPLMARELGIGTELVFQ